MEYPDSTLLQVTILSHKVKKKKKKINVYQRRKGGKQKEIKLS